ncbi:MAG TPA: hypothetical protein VGM88_09185 [Kofleriaceae bacterium]
MRLALLAATLCCVACAAGEASAAKRGAHAEYDVFLPRVRSPENRHDEFGLRGRPPDAALARAALREDSRADVRAGALSLLAQLEGDRASADFVAALDDESDDVAALAAHLIKTSAPAMTGDRDAVSKHWARLRAVLERKGPTEEGTARANAADAAIYIRATDALPVLLRDANLLSTGVALAELVTLRPADISELKAAAERFPHDTSATLLLLEKTPDIGLPLFVAAIDRGDMDAANASIVVQRNLTAAVPGMLRAVLKQPDLVTIRWLDAIAALRATCAAPALIALYDSPFGDRVTRALGTLSGHPDWTEPQLREWAKRQRADVAPCRR